MKFSFCYQQEERSVERHFKNSLLKMIGLEKNQQSLLNKFDLFLMVQCENRKCKMKALKRNILKSQCVDNKKQEDRILSFIEITESEKSQTSKSSIKTFCCHFKYWLNLINKLQLKSLFQSLLNFIESMKRNEIYLMKMLKFYLQRVLNTIIHSYHQCIELQSNLTKFHLLRLIQL